MSATLQFTKIHGLGNDYVYLDSFAQKLPRQLSHLAKFVSDRNFGIGSDGLIILQPSKRADCRMIMYNSDGSRGLMCGNGIRGVAKYLYEHGICRRKTIQIETDSGIKSLHLQIKQDKVRQISVDMGKPIFARMKIPMRGRGADALAEKIATSYGTWIATCLSIGNPHCVIFIPNCKQINLKEIGPAIQKKKLFPQGVNVEFVSVLRQGVIAQRTFERGAGETLACGSGACAAAVAAILRGYAKAKVKVHLRGGSLLIEWAPGGSVWMRGPAEEVFSGTFEVAKPLRQWNW